MTATSITIANFLLVICYTFALWVISTQSKKLVGMRTLAWAYSSVLIFSVLALTTYKQVWLLRAIAPEFLLIGFFLLYRTFLQFSIRPLKHRWIWATLCGLTVLFYIWSGFYFDHNLIRSAVTSGIVGLQAILSGVMLYRYAPREVRTPSRVMAVSYLLFGGRAVVRCILIATLHKFPESLPGLKFQIIGISIALVLNAFTPLGYLWMAANRLQSEMETLSSTDSLTGTLNRRAFDERGRREVMRSLRHKLAMSLVAIDIDHFKKVNDGFGHIGGDYALVRVAETIRSLLRATDAVARFGGDEFVILLPATGLSGAFELAERVRASIEKVEIEMHQDRLHVRASFGVASLAGLGNNSLHGDAWEELLQNADTALYRAKNKGRNRVESELITHV